MTIKEEIPENEIPDNEDNADSRGKVGYSNLGLWGGERGKVTIHMDKDLYKAFKPFAKRYFGSVCCAIEGYMAGILGAIENSEVYLGNSVAINDFHVHRNLRERRRLDPDMVDDGVSLEEVQPLIDLVEAFREKWDGEKSLGKWDVIKTAEETKRGYGMEGRWRYRHVKRVLQHFRDEGWKVSF